MRAMSVIGVLVAPRRRVRTLVVAAVLVALSAPLGEPAQSAQGTIRIIADPTQITAQGGRAQIVVQLPSSAADGETHVTLTTDLGAFTADSGPQRLDAPLAGTGGSGLLRASTVLVGDGRAGVSVVTARVGNLIDTVTVRFIGPAASLSLRAPLVDRPLDALRTHRIEVAVRDTNEYAVSGANVTFEIIQAAAGAELRSGARAEPERMTVVSSSSGTAAVSLAGTAGVVRLRASSGSATLEIRLEMHGEPARLRLIALDGETLHEGQATAAGSLQALLVDRSGRSAPGQRIGFESSAGGPFVVADEEGESFFTDSGGRARVHLDASQAQLGTHTITARWSRGGRTLTDTVEVVVSGRPVAMYLTARLIIGDLGDPLNDPLPNLNQYRVNAQVVDVNGQPVAGNWEVRWRPLVAGSRASAAPEVSSTRNGVASSVFTLHHDGDGAPDLTSVQAQAWLIAAAQVNNVGAIADLVTAGLPLRTGWNAVTWRGGAVSVSEALAPIAHAATAVWRQSAAGSWEAWFTASVPGATDFRLADGDRIFIVLHSAARFENVER